MINISHNIKSVLVTGCEGFLGSHIVNLFNKKGISLYGVDRNPKTRHSYLKKYHPISLPADLKPLLIQLKPEFIIHAAGPASVAWSRSNPVEDFIGTADGLVSLLDSVRRSNLNVRIIYLSSAAVYGEPESLPVSENTPFLPISPYGYHKYVSEIILREFYEIYSIRSCIMRIFSAYGIGLQRQVIWDLLQKIRKHDLVEVLGTGNETRDFIYGSDVAWASYCLAKNAEFKAEAYNVAGGIEISIREVVETLINACNLKREIRYTGSSRPGDPMRWRADIKKIAELGFIPEVDFKSGISKVVTLLMDQR